MKNYLEFHQETLQMIGNYGKVNPELMGAFSKLHFIAAKQGELSKKQKELIALGISINSKCEGCIAMHIHDAMENGATRTEIVETIGTSIYMGGGPSVIHGVKAFAAYEEFAKKQLIIKN